MDNLDATDSFYKAIKEIEVLIYYAKRNIKTRIKYVTFNKASIVLLCTKFESFLESFLEDYAHYNLNNTTNKTLDRAIYEHLITNIVSDLTHLINNEKKRNQSINKLIGLCGNLEIKPVKDINIKIDTKLRLGKHGQLEIEKLLKKFGFKEFIELEDIKPLFERINSLIAIRHNIIHEDATPTLTHKDVEAYQGDITKFVNLLQECANKKIEKIIIS